MRENVGKLILSEFLSYLKYKVDNDLLTMEEVESIVRTLEDNLTVLGTADGVVANFPEKGLFLATDRTAILREVEATKTTLKQDLDQVPAKQKMYADYEKLSLELNPELQKEAAQAQELASLRGEVAELKELLRASLGQNKKEE